MGMTVSGGKGGGWGMSVSSGSGASLISATISKAAGALLASAEYQPQKQG